MVRGKNLISVLHTQYITNLRETFTSSPILDVIYDCCSKQNSYDEEEEVLFTTYFPNFTEFQAIHKTLIRTIYFLGNVTDEKSAKFLNQLSKDAVDNGLSDGYKIINLKTEV